MNFPASLFISVSAMSSSISFCTIWADESPNLSKIFLLEYDDVLLEEGDLEEGDLDEGDWDDDDLDDDDLDEGDLDEGDLEEGDLDFISIYCFKRK